MPNDIRKKIHSLKLAISWMYKSSKILMISIILLVVLGGLLTIIEPYLFRLIIDHVVENTNLDTGSKLGIGVAGLLGVYAISRMLDNMFWDFTNLIRRYHNLKIESHVTQRLMERISSLDMVYFEDPEYYNTLSRANEGFWRITEVFWNVTFSIRQIVSIIVIVGALLLFNWAVVALVLFAAIPSILLVFRFGELEWTAFSASSPISRHANYYKSLLTEQPESIKEIRTFGLRGHFIQKFRSLFDSYVKRQGRVVSKQVFWYAIIAIVEGGLSAVAAYLVVQSFIGGAITIGELTFFWALLFQFASQVRWLVASLGDINKNTIFLTPMVDVMEFKPHVIESNNPKKFPVKMKRGIEFRNVTFYYPRSKKPALKNFNLFIKPGENIAIVGENGSGKTTLIKLLCRLYDVTSGEILIDGVNIKEYSLDGLYESIGVIFQDFMKYEALVAENISFGRLSGKHDADSIHKSAIKSGAWVFVKGLDKQYKTQLGKKLKDDGVELSVGQWQKVALARAFFRDAQIMILDEPTAAVDAKAEYELFKKFERLTKDKTTVLISHRFSTVRMADKIIVMDKGRLIESGTHDDLLKKNGVYANLFKLQARGYR